jgi:hypothetical protein
MSEKWQDGGKAARRQDRLQGAVLEWDKNIPSLRLIWITYSSVCLLSGRSINWRDTPELLRAAGRSLELRIESGAGKERAAGMYISIYARLLDGEKTDRLFGRCLRYCSP